MAKTTENRFILLQQRERRPVYGTNTVIVLMHLCFNIMKSNKRAEGLFITCSQTNSFAGENVFFLLNVSARGNDELLVSLVKYLWGVWGWGRGLEGEEEEEEEA